MADNIADNMPSPTGQRCNYTQGSLADLTSQMAEAAKDLARAAARYNGARAAVVEALAREEEQLVDDAILSCRARMVAALEKSAAPLSVRELAQAVGLSPSRAFRVALAVLKGRGRIQSAGRGKYTVPRH